MRNFTRILLLACLTLIYYSDAGATAYISNLKASSRNGQTFLTWTCPAGTNFKYNVYRSKSLLDLKSKLNNTHFLGYVRDSSTLNIRQTRIRGSKVFFNIQDGEAALASNKGLYVVTCTENTSFYYAVTVTDLTLNKEYKKITMGTTSLLSPVSEVVADPQPVLQGTEILNATGDLSYKYVQFGNNQDLNHYPSMFSQGSYGFNFFIVYRGNYENGPLFTFYEGLEGNALVGSGLGTFDTMTNCVIISMDDWLPVPNGYGPTGGLNTFWSGYHEDFNPYTLSNPIPSSGTVRMYPQHRYIHTLNWASKYLPIDSNRIYLLGISAGGFGALLTTMIIPQKIAAVYTMVTPVVIKASAQNGTDTTDEKFWGVEGSNLPADVNDPITGTPLSISDLMNIKTMLSKNENIGLPPIYSIHGKNDLTVVWSDKPTYLNQNETYDQGGIHFWDQRSHEGSGANFTDAETTPDFSRFRSNLSYPAFAFCTVNENPGDGTPENGDAYGSYNGYITWDTLTDASCKWTCHMFMPDFTAGGVIQHSEYTYCNADVTVRRPQVFNPADGVILKWKTYDKNNVAIANGSFNYDGGPITIPGIKIKRKGTRLEISIKNCTSREEDDIPTMDSLTELAISNTFNGWRLNIYSDHQQATQLQLVDILGRIIKTKFIELTNGVNSIDVDAPMHGTFVIKLDGEEINESAKVIF
ncbi:MAG: hypothetical protein ABIQ74_04735 [Chitinophagales bacterium]